MRRSIVAIVVMVLIGAGCVGRFGAGSSTCPEPGSSAVVTSSDAPLDEPAQVVREYGEAHPDEFAGVYFDVENSGRLVARFIGNVSRHQCALDGLLGSPGRVTVLGAIFTEVALQAIADAIARDHIQLEANGISLLSAGVDVIDNNVDIEAKSDNGDAERTLQAYGPPGTIDVALYPADKPWTQPADGPGWRLLGVFDTDLPYTVAVAVDDPALVAEWDRYGLPGEPPGWEPSSEVVIILSYGMGSSCPELRLDGVAMNEDARLVYGEVSDPFEPRACTADLVGGKTFVVAVERDQLPPSPFTLRLNEQPNGCEPDCGSGPATLDVDLR